MVQTTTPTLDLAAVRQDFPILDTILPNGQKVIYLDSGATAQKPRQVIEKERECQESYYANAYRGIYYFGAKVDEEIEAARSKVQQLIHAREAEEIIFTSGTTMAINLVANAWGRKFLQPGDEILLNEMEHHANIVPWQLIAQERQAVLRYIPLTDDGQLDLSQLDEVLTERTKLVAVTGMSNVLGTINPVDVLSAKAKQVGALILVDGAQVLPHQPVNVMDPEIDFLAFSGHKLFGPSGIGCLYGRREILEEMNPFLGGGHMIAEVHRDHSTFAEIPARFEAGTPPIVQAIALGSAIDYVTGLGYEAIHRQEQCLLEYAHEQLLQIPGMTIYGPEVSQKGAIVSFTIENLHPQDLAVLLDRKGVCVRHGHHCTMPLHTRLGLTASTRVSLAFYNTNEDIDGLIEGIHFARKRLRLV